MANVDEKPEGTAPPPVDANGVTMHGDYPFNSRSRAEALASDGKDEDPDGIVSPELIADAAQRIAGDTPSTSWPKHQLVAQAKRVGAPTSGSKGDLVAAIHAAPAANGAESAPHSEA